MKNIELKLRRDKGIINLNLHILFSRFCLISFLIGFSFISNAQTLRNIENKAFQRGEELRYRVSYYTFLTGNVVAGEAALFIRNENKQIAGRNTLHCVGLGLSKGAFNMFFKVVDRYETYIDEEAIAPWLFIRRVNEGGYKIEQDIAFNQNKKIATNMKKSEEYTVPAYVQDLLSAFYYARTLDFQSAKTGDEFTITTFLDWELYPMKIKITGREKLKTDIGSFNCIKFMPLLQIGNVFKDEEDLTIWVTDDKNKIPIRAEANILVGSVRMDLTKYAGLANPLSSLIAK